ncbi:MAG TPA: thioredoxin-like domain-containing protein, partial [Bacteroidales bacterium]|nr:thioredoxin-like domain-containing protein [Bacteroidales bacterium]
MIRKIFLTAVFCTLGVVMVLAQGTNIKFQIKGMPDDKEEVILAHYYGDKQYIDDTIRVDVSGRGEIKSDTLLPQGIYMMVLEQSNYFELLIGKDQQFSFTTNADDFIGSTKFEGSEVNEGFQEYQRFMLKQNNQNMALRKRMQAAGDNSDSVQIIKAKLNVLDLNVKQKWEELEQKHPNTMLSVLINGMKNPEIPEFEIDPQVENKDSARWFLSYNYNKQHFWDNIDFSDARLLYTPVFHRRLNHYFTNVLVPNPDTLISYIDKTLQQTNGNEQMFRYMLQYFINNFQGTKIMGMDKVFVHLAENYYLTDKVDWISDETRKDIRERMLLAKPNLIGNVAPDLKLPNSFGEYERLHDISAEAILVYFWEPGCGHCKKATPIIKEAYEKFRDAGFEVFAVYTQNEKDRWIEYIHEKNIEWINVFDPYYTSNFRGYYNVRATPMLYLLDKDKKIIAKQFAAKDLE